MVPRHAKEVQLARFGVTQCFDEGKHSDYALCTVMRRLTKGIRSEKYVVTRFCRCADVTERTYTNLDSTV